MQTTSNTVTMGTENLKHTRAHSQMNMSWKNAHEITFIHQGEENQINII